MKRIFVLLLAILVVSSFSITAFAAPVDEATIDTSRTGSLDIYKYDLTNAEKDGVWDSSYVSTGVKDESGVEAVLGDPSRVSALNANGNAYGYAIKGVEFTYVRVASIRTFTESENGAEHIEVLYGIAPTEQNNAFNKTSFGEVRFCFGKNASPALHFSKEVKAASRQGSSAFFGAVLRCRAFFMQKRKPETSSDFHTLYFSAFSFSAIHSSTMFSIVRNCAAVSFRILPDKRS